MFLNDNFTVLQILNEEECKKTIRSIEDNSHKLKVSDENGDIYLSIYEMQLTDLSDDVREMILKNLKGVVDYRMTLVQSMILKYSEDLINEMPGHYDTSERTLVINLNNNFDGGETKFHFHQHEHKPQKHPVGCGILFKGDSLRSWHKAKPVTNGVRYTLVFKWMYYADKDKEFNLTLKLILKILRRFFNFISLWFLCKVLKKIKWLK